MIYRIGKRKKLNAEINVVPYIDVMLVLLIIFMVLSPLLIQGIEVNLPKTDTTKMSISDEPLVISINESGKYTEDLLTKPQFGVKAYKTFTLVGGIFLYVKFYWGIVIASYMYFEIERESALGELLLRHRPQEKRK